MNWLRGSGGSYTGRERSAQPAKRIAKAAPAAGRTIRNFMRADNNVTRNNFEQIFSNSHFSTGNDQRKSREGCTKFEFVIKDGSEIGARNSGVCYQLLERLGWD
jgi:hypothetical protein